PLSPGGHKGAEIAITLCVYGVAVCWLRRNRGALVHQEYEREQKRAWMSKDRQPRPEPVIHDDEPWDDAWLSWHSHAHDTDTQRRWYQARATPPGLGGTGHFHPAHRTAVPASGDGHCPGSLSMAGQW